MMNSELPVNFTCQTTLNKQINFSGISLHKGVISNMTIKPSKVNTGIVFQRIDKNYKQNVINAHFLQVSDTLMCTKLTNEHSISISQNYLLLLNNSTGFYGVRTSQQI